MKRVLSLAMLAAVLSNGIAQAEVQFGPPAVLGGTQDSLLATPDGLIQRDRFKLLAPKYRPNRGDPAPLLDIDKPKPPPPPKPEPAPPGPYPLPPPPPPPPPDPKHNLLGFKKAPLLMPRQQLMGR